MLEYEKKLKISPKVIQRHVSRERIFFHVDLDSFFASVEQIKNPKLRGKPIVVGGRSSRRGVVAAASYEAKRLGIDSGMTWGEAKKLSPQVICLPADFESYSIYSNIVRKILERMAPVVAPASVDESVLDMTGCEKIYGTFFSAAEKIRSEIFKRTGLSASIGISSTHSVAKLAATLAKPAGILEVPAGSEGAFLSPLPIDTLPGIGPRLGESIRKMGIETLGQLAKIDPAILEKKFGVYGFFLVAKARGEDNWDLEVTEKIKSIGKEETFEHDLVSLKEMRNHLWELVEKVGRKLREEKLFARTVRVKIRYSNFQTEMASKVLRDPTDFDRVLFRFADSLFQQLIETERPVRLIGFAAGDLTAQPPQLDLWRTATSHRWERFYQGIDSIRNRFGRKFIRLGS